MNAIEIAHYGRWFPYNDYKYPFWWFDQKYKRAVHIDTLCGIMGYKSADEINIDECRMAGYVPWFCLDVYKRQVEYDETGSIGKRYRRQDEAGTPLCVTVDFDTLETGKVTVRDRDTMKQDVVAIDELVKYIEEKIAF